jgi:hypothetical protein
MLLPKNEIIAIGRHAIRLAADIISGTDANLQQQESEEGGRHLIGMTMAKKLHSPVRVGPYTLSHRVAFAPCTRLRSSEGDLPNDLMAEYYAQRASFGDC